MTAKLDPALRIDSEPDTENGSALEGTGARKIPPGRPKVAARKEIAQRLDEIIALRIRGKHWNEIDQIVGYSRRGSAQRFYRDQIQGIPAANARELRETENARYDKLVEKLWPAAMQLDYDAIDRLLRISQARRQLNGLDLEPKFVLDMPGNDGPEPDNDRVLELRAQLESLSFEDKQAILAPLLRLGLVGSTGRPG